MTEIPQRISIRSARVLRTARYAILGEFSPDVAEIWFVLHGYGQLAERFISRFESIASAQRVIVAPEALSRYYVEQAPGYHSARSQVGASWMTVEDRESEIRDYVEYLNAIYDEVLARLRRREVIIRVLGFSQGASTAARWIATGHANADQVILWAGSLPDELTAESARLLSARNPLLFVVGDGDQYLTGRALEKQLQTLSKLGVHHRELRFDGSHEIDASVLRDIAKTVTAPD